MAITPMSPRARRTAAELGDWIDQGYDIIAPIPSCALMFKFEWPLIVADDPAVRRIAEHTADITEYIVDIAANEGLADGLEPLAGSIVVHLACHARAQNMGPKAVDMLKLIPDTELTVIERCPATAARGGSRRIFSR